MPLTVDGYQNVDELMNLLRLDRDDRGLSDGRAVGEIAHEHDGEVQQTNR